MRIQVKICGLSTEETVEAAVEGKADYVGFVFYPRSPRAVSVARATDLARLIPRPILKCGLFVDADDAAIFQAVEQAGLDVLQLHGSEPPDRCAWLRERTGRPVMKAISVAGDKDIREAERWFGAVDLLLFDAKPPKTPASLPGGNGVTFDWSLLAGRQFPLPWLLSGGLNPENVRGAIKRAWPQGVDVSSGVELSPGIKDPKLIRNFLEEARQ